jgi:hypothetical protein
MIYQGDSYTFLCNLANSDGSLPTTISTPPRITVFNALTGTPIVPDTAMVAVAGVNGLYGYSWAIPLTAASGDYVAISSFVTNARNVLNQFLEKVRVGDSRILDVAAKDATCAKDATVAHDTTVAHITDLSALSPANNPIIQQILAKVINLPSDPASNTVVNTLAPLIGDVRDFALGSWSLDRSVNPQVMTLYRLDGTVLATFQNSTSGLVDTRQHS